MISLVQSLIYFFLLFSWSEESRAGSIDRGHPILGHWQFVSYLLDGVELPKPNPNLHIEFDFFDDGVNRLYWHRSNEKGFCERFAQYSISQDRIREMVIWVNPKNNRDCSRDPDMQTGRQNVIPYRFDAKGRLLIKVYVGTYDVWYIWERRTE